MLALLTRKSLKCSPKDLHVNINHLTQMLHISQYRTSASYILLKLQLATTRTAYLRQLTPDKYVLGTLMNSFLHKLITGTWTLVKCDLRHVSLASNSMHANTPTNCGFLFQVAIVKVFNYVNTLNASTQLPYISRELSRLTQTDTLVSMLQR